ncbi:MAG TPA: PD-(D/E)XK nuclease family protein [Gammaproteobacteria bacterium]
MASSLRPLVDIPPGATLVVRDALVARQWEAFLARGALADGARCWRTPPVVPYGRWLAERRSETDDGGALLGRRQALALWRAVIDRSPARERLVAVEGPAQWAADAWRLLQRYRIDSASLRAGHAEPDFRAFLAWCRDYAAALRERGWVDAAELEGLLATRGFARPGPLVLVDRDDETAPAERALLDAWHRAGGTWAPLAMPACTPRRVRVPLADAEEERRAAAEWASRRLAANPSARVALVVADLAQSFDDVERALDDAFGGERGRWWSPYAGRLASDPVVGAALARIALLTPAGTFADLSRWLRELPPSGAPAAAARALLERELRDDVAAQLPFLAAYRGGGWRRRLHDAAPELAQAIDGALRELGDERLRTPSAWAAAWQRALPRLEWPPPQSPHETLRAWEAALGELRRLTPVLGAVSATEALRELEDIAGGQRRPAPLPVAGVFVLAHPDEVGPGYDAVWLTGFADARWPEPTRLNPLLPRRLQRAHGMPWATPQDALRRSARSLARLCAAVPEVIASWPARLHDYAAEPSPALREFVELSPAEALGDGPPARPRAAPTRLEMVADPAPPLPGTSVRGGAGVLNLQARAPLRAFCQYRLGARALEPVTSGVSPRLQGIAAHRALESLYAPLVDAGGAGPTPLPSAARAEAAAEAALAGVFGEARGALRALFRLERDRLVDALGALLAAEATRPPFAVEAVERKERVTVAGRTLEVRIDRLDRLEDGTLAILDYKTGDAANAGDWLKERLGDAQVPLYAVHLAPPEGAAVLVTLAPERAEYSGIWERPGALPGRRRAPRDDAWRSQLAAWRAQLETLVTELAAGDVRVFVSELEPLEGAYAPLTRIREQLALHRAAMRSRQTDD